MNVEALVRDAKLGYLTNVESELLRTISRLEGLETEIRRFCDRWKDLTEDLRPNDEPVTKEHIGQALAEITRLKEETIAEYG